MSGFESSLHGRQWVEDASVLELLQSLLLC